MANPRSLFRRWTRFCGAMVLLVIATGLMRVEQAAFASSGIVPVSYVFVCIGIVCALFGLIDLYRAFASGTEKDGTS